MLLAASCASRSWLAAGGKFGFRRKPTVAACGTRSRNKPSRLGSTVAVKRLMPVTFPPVTEACDEAAFDWVGSEYRDDWNCHCRGLGGQRRRFSARRNEDRHRSTGEFRRKRWQAVVPAVGPAVFDRHVPTLSIAGLPQTATERLHEICAFIVRPRAEKSDHRHRRLLRAPRERPRRRATEQRYELAPSDFDHRAFSRPIAQAHGRGSVYRT